MNQLIFYNPNRKKQTKHNITLHIFNSIDCIWWHIRLCFLSLQDIHICNVSLIDLARSCRAVIYTIFYMATHSVRYACPCHPGLQHDATSTYSLRRRHNGRDSVSNHQPHDCFLNRLFRRRSKKTSKLRVTGLCVGNSPGLVNSPHKWPVTRKMFPFDDVIMCNYPSTLALKNMHISWVFVCFVVHIVE